ncbi:MAG: thioredoxin [Patescibacteria group bacterium]
MVKVLELETVDDFSKNIAGTLTIVDFFAVWCGPCQMMKPIFEKVAEEMEGINFISVDVDKFSELAAKYDVMSIPTFVIFKDGQAITVKNGAMSESDFRNWIEKNK